MFTVLFFENALETLCFLRQNALLICTLVLSIFLPMYALLCKLPVYVPPFLIPQGTRAEGAYFLFCDLI